MPLFYVVGSSENFSQIKTMINNVPPFWSSCILQRLQSWSRMIIFSNEVYWERERYIYFLDNATKIISSNEYCSLCSIVYNQISKLCAAHGTWNGLGLKSKIIVIIITVILALFSKPWHSMSLISIATSFKIFNRSH